MPSPTCERDELEREGRGARMGVEGRGGAGKGGVRCDGVGTDATSSGGEEMGRGCGSN